MLPCSASDEFAEPWRRPSQAHASAHSHPATQRLPPAPAHNLGLRIAIEEVLRATWSPVDSGEETEKSAIMFTSAGVSSTWKALREGVAEGTPVGYSVVHY